MGMRLRWTGAGVLVAAVWMAAYNLPLLLDGAFAVVGALFVVAGLVVGAIKHD